MQRYPMGGFFRGVGGAGGGAVLSFSSCGACRWPSSPYSHRKKSVNLKLEMDLAVPDAPFFSSLESQFESVRVPS